MKRFTPIALILVLVLCFRTWSGETPAAYEEVITTPHWIQKTAHAGGTVKALFIVNALAEREPAELAQRFDLTADRLPALRESNAYRNKFDLNLLPGKLAAKPDVLVISASKVWHDLGAKGCEQIAAAVKNGLPLVIFTRGNIEGELRGLFPPEKKAPAKKVDAELLELGLEDKPPPPPPPLPPYRLDQARDITKSVAGDLRLAALLGARAKGLKVVSVPVGKGVVFVASPYDRHFIFFHAFFPERYKSDTPEVVPEAAYLLAERIIRHAAGKAVQGPLATVKNQDVDGATQLQLKPDRPAPGHLFWQVFSPWGQVLASGKGPLTQAASQPFKHQGDVFVYWQALDAQGRQTSAGLQPLSIKQDNAIQEVLHKEVIPRGKDLLVRWQLASTAQPDQRMELQLYDANQALLRTVSVKAQAGQAVIPGWQAGNLAHRLRLLLLRGDAVLDEERRTVYTRPDPNRDLQQWHTIVWSTERGNLGERWRYQRLRQLGISAMATVGRSSGLNKAAAAAGMRVVPTNVFVPKNRFNTKKFNEEKSRQRLKEFAPHLAPLSPLGYSLADEPTGETLSWRDKAEAILRPIDPNARIGYCGVFPRDPAVVPLLKTSRFLTPYSPYPLYGVDLWRGIERDVYRSFMNPDGIMTLWTHYAPWKDHEPYSRSAPWVWLLDGTRGISYFMSGANFAVLNSDLTTTHETRWWREEIALIASGIGEQVIRMKRDTGAVRLLYNGSRGAVQPWAKALNRSNTPYILVDARQPEMDRLAGARLVIAADAPVVGRDLAEGLAKVIAAGGVVIGSHRFAGSGAGAEKATALFGFTRKGQAAKGGPLNGVRCAAALSGAGKTVTLEGLTTGELLPAGNAAGGALPFARVGDLAVRDAAKAPPALKPLFASPAVRVGSQGRAIYLAVQPDLASITDWLPQLLKQAKVKTPSIRLTDQTKGAPPVYGVTFREGPVRVVGLVPDYIRSPARWSLGKKKGIENRAWFHHGPERWAPLKSTLESQEKAHVYDMRAGRYLGHVTSAQVELLPGKPRLYAFLPYKVEAVALAGADAAKAGEDVTVKINLKTSGSTAGQHVVRVALSTSANETVPSCTANVHLTAGKGEVRLTLPAGLEPGVYPLTVRDVLSGVVGTKALSVNAAATIPTLPQKSKIVRVTRKPLDWPAGEWQEQLDDVKKPAVAAARVGKLSQKIIRYGPHNGKRHLMANFTFANPLRTYKLKYLVCNDKSVQRGGEFQRVRALNSTGLGINGPRAMLWYYNGYIQISLDGVQTLDFAMTSTEDTSKDGIARARLTWKTPKGLVQLDYAMLPDHEGLFHRLTVKPSVPLSSVALQLRGYPAGVGKNAGKAFVRVPQEEKSWMLMGDAVRDRAFFPKGQGCAGLLIKPEQWKKIAFHGRPSLQSPKRATASKDPFTFAWVCWIFPERTNGEALAYMRSNAGKTRELLDKVFQKH